MQSAYVIKNSASLYTAPPCDRLRVRRSLLVFPSFQSAKHVNNFLTSDASSQWLSNGSLLLYKKTPEKNRAKRIGRSIHHVSMDSLMTLVLGHTHLDLYAIEDIGEHSRIKGIILQGYFQETFKLPKPREANVEYYRKLIEHNFENNEIQTFIEDELQGQMHGDEDEH